MAGLVKDLLQALQWKLPALQWEADLATAASLSVDGARFMLSFFAACGCAAVLRSLTDMQSAHSCDVSPFDPCFGARAAGAMLCTWREVTSLAPVLADSETESNIETLHLTHRCAAARKTFALVSGVVLCFYAFGAGVAHGFVSVVVNWAILRLCPAHAGTLAWAFNFPHLAAWCAPLPLLCLR